MDIYSWICNKPSSINSTESESQLVLQLASSSDESKSILLKAEPISDSRFTLSICLQGFFLPSYPYRTLWVSTPCSVDSLDSTSLLPLLLQLLQETMARAPAGHDGIIPFKLRTEPVTRALASIPSESFARFFNLALLCKLFWLCVCDAPTEAGSLYFQAMAPSVYTLLQCKPALTAFLASVGADGELLFMRTLGYMLAKWLILSDLGEVHDPSPRHHLCLSHARETHGLWVLKGYAPVSAMTRTRSNGQHSTLDLKESALKYALAHQHLEAVVQLEYSVSFHEKFVRLGVRLDNVRIHVTRLRLGRPTRDELEDDDDDDDDEGEQKCAGERHFPSRVRIRVGPSPGPHVSALTLGRSTENPEREVKTERDVKGTFGKSKNPTVKARARTGTRSRTRSWRWEQDAEGNTAIFEGVLCDNESGAEVATWRPGTGKLGGFRKRFSGAHRAFNKSGGLVFAGDEYGEEVSWRLGQEDMEMMMREMDGGDLKWRLGGKVWLSYLPCDFNTTYCETRCVEWNEEVELPLNLNK